MIGEIKFPTCTSCKRPITPDMRGTKFYCPQCGGFLIWRCWRCRKQANAYKCPRCGFEGP